MIYKEGKTPQRKDVVIEKQTVCNYAGCSEPVLSTSKDLLCIFHDKNKDKDTERFREAIAMKLDQEDYNFERYIFPTSISFTGIKFNKEVNFKYAHFLDDVDFWDVEFAKSVNFSGAQFEQAANFLNSQFHEKADFKFARFENYANFISAIFEGKSSLKNVKFVGKANFSGVEFSDKMDFTNTPLGCCEFIGSNIEKVDLTGAEWPDDYKTSEEREAVTEKHYREVEEVYRKIKLSYQRTGDYVLAGEFYYRELECKRKQLSRSHRWFGWHSLYRITCGYGERPWRIFGCSVFVIFLGTIVYLFGGLRVINGEYITMIGYPEAGFGLIKNLALSLYYSVIVFLTLGAEDVIPVGLSKVFASIEGFVGLFLMALFITVFCRKMLR